eukprot:GSMAST32.ASY1.ANO1.1187.1 assembled CDS
MKGSLRKKRIDRIEKSISEKVFRMESIFNHLKLPCPILFLVATSKDAFRKWSSHEIKNKKVPDNCTDCLTRGNHPLWKLLSLLLPKYLQTKRYPCIEKSFYVGDAAGRDDDHSDCDKIFAENLGLQFWNNTEFFGQLGALGATMLMNSKEKSGEKGGKKNETQIESTEKENKGSKKK